MSSRLLTSTSAIACRRSTFQSSSVFGALCSVPSSVATTSTESQSASAAGSTTESMMSFTVDVGRYSAGVDREVQPDASRTEANRTSIPPRINARSVALCCYNPLADARTDVRQGHERCSMTLQARTVGRLLLPVAMLLILFVVSRSSSDAQTPAAPANVPNA